MDVIRRVLAELGDVSSSVPEGEESRLIGLFMRLETCLSLQQQRKSYELATCHKFGYAEAALRLGWAPHRDMKYCHGAVARAHAATRFYPNYSQVRGHLTDSNLFLDTAGWALLRGPNSLLGLAHYIDMEEKLNV